MKVKVCGMRDAQNIEALLQLKPNFMGFIFYDKSPRFVGETLDVDQLKAFPKEVKKVGVFVNASIDFIVKTVKKYELDYAQLHGEEKPDFCKTLRLKGVSIIRAFSLDSTFSFAQVYNYKPFCDFFLFDAKGQNRGGNGVSFDWGILKKYDFEKPFLLAGGVDIGHAAMLEELPQMPYCMDINSKFELEPGLKNIQKIEEFMKLI
jgi:phosphoribosylanthranilate isomerase